MSEAQTEFIKGIASILNVKDEKILKKGVELIALLNLKPQLSCSATCKGIICLDIASSFTSNPINKEDAIKYSGCKKKTYINMYNNISKLLSLDKVYSVKEICLLTNVCDVKEPAVKLFDKFKIKCNKVHYDFEHPMYSCAAVWAICRLVEISRVKKTELDDLTKKFEELIEVKNPTEKKEEKKKQKAQKIVTPIVEEQKTLSRKRKQNTGIMTDEEYLEWKRQMLEE
ncbi:hypothetical protein RUM44_005282 [Polyplax serrata]|uniref:Origin recognition complex subunit 6 n=1 Tax=Polyplax serrata TaxID=468196 RepID=A0ABR1AEK4_POLSC